MFYNRSNPCGNDQMWCRSVLVGDTLYVVDADSNMVNVINIVTKTSAADPIAVGADPQNIVFTPDGTRAYVTSGSNEERVMSTATQAVIATILIMPDGMSPKALFMVPRGRFVYVANLNSNHVSVIDTMTSAVIKTIPVRVQPFNFTS